MSKFTRLPFASLVMAIFLVRPCAAEIESLKDGTRVWVPNGWTTQQDRPVILFLHGVGESGADHERPLNAGIYPNLTKNPALSKALIVFPQCPSGKSWTSPDMADLAWKALWEAMDRYRGDRSRIHLTGLSMGGYGLWEMVLLHPGVFASLTAISSGAVDPPTDSRLAFIHIDLGPRSREQFDAELADKVGSTPTRVFHGDRDPLVPPDEMADFARRFKGRPSFRFALIAGGHGVWDNVYRDPAWSDWLFSQVRRTN